MINEKSSNNDNLEEPKINNNEQSTKINKEPETINSLEEPKINNDILNEEIIINETINSNLEKTINNLEE